MSLPVGFATCYLVMFTGKRTKQFFIVKFDSLTAIHMYLLLREVFYNGRRYKIFYTIIFPASAPQIRRYQQEPVNGA